MPNQTRNQNRERQIPIITANAKPFRLVIRNESDSWSPTTDELNQRKYDYVKLHRLSTYLDVGIRPFSLGVCFDGTLILPAIETYRNRESALEKINQTLAELLVGGLYCEAAEPDDIGFGSLSMTAYTRMHGGATGPSASLNNSLRLCCPGSLDAIKLLKPETVTIGEMQSALELGRRLLGPLGSIPQEQILYGVTFFVRKQWSESLIHLWTTTERIVETAWQKQVVDFPTQPSKKRRAFLEDHRTWPISTKLEVLHQKQLLPSEVHDVLDEVRKARNDFAHRGIQPDHQLACKALRSCFELASLCASEFTERGLFSKVVGLAESRCDPELYPKKTKFETHEVSHWMEIPPIPGDSHWGDRPYELIQELFPQPLPRADS